MNNKYYLTDKGKDYANRMDTDNDKFQIQAKLSVWCVCYRKICDEIEVLIGTRMKQPFYGCQGFVAGKIKFGEKITESAKREVKEETNLNGDPKLIQIRHYIVYKNQELVEDKYMFLCAIENPIGELISNYEVKLDWVKISELDKFVTKPFSDVSELNDVINAVLKFNGEVTVVEKVEENENY